MASRKLRYGFWAANAIGLGVWETTALTTRRLPTVSSTVRAANEANSRLTHLALGLWLFGLAHHLLYD